MPLIIPKTLPAYDALYNENIFVMHRERALAQHIGNAGDWLLLWIRDDGTAMFMRTGSHDELLGK